MLARLDPRQRCVHDHPHCSHHADHSSQHIADPAQNTRLLNDQLRALGLYAADTMGDGNCLFRALSDQLYGTESRHAQLRTDICNWVESHKERYAPFCDDERGLDTHLGCMRELGKSNLTK
jgi:OTU domain-containing protein 3